MVIEELASTRVVVRAFVASRAQRHRLNQFTITQDIQGLPGRLVGVRIIPGMGLAPGRIILGFRFIVKVEQGDVAELEVSELGQRLIGQLDRVEALVAVARTAHDRVNVGLIGG